MELVGKHVVSTSPHASVFHSELFFAVIALTMTLE